MTRALLERKSLEFFAKYFQFSSLLGRRWRCTSWPSCVWITTMWLIQANALWMWQMSFLNWILNSPMWNTPEPGGKTIVKTWYCDCSISLSPWGIPMNRALLEQEIDLVICHWDFLSDLLLQQNLACHGG